MIFTSNYRVTLRGNSCYIISRERHFCPNCQIPLRPRDFKRRTAIDSNGKIRTYHLRRLKCPCCGTSHLELPDIFIPHKHYTRAAIESAIQNPETCCSAEDSTIQRWKQELAGRA